MITVLTIVEEHLRRNGYDGLVSGDRECACVITDLAPCDGICNDCEPGWLAADHKDYDFMITVDESER